ARLLQRLEPAMQHRVGVFRRRRIARLDPERDNPDEQKGGARQAEHASSSRLRGSIRAVSPPANRGPFPASRQPLARVRKQPRREIVPAYQLSRRAAGGGFVYPGSFRWQATPPVGVSIAATRN